jgi:alpha-amylase/alpha-mannosidase (GH57 family)
MTEFNPTPARYICVHGHFYQPPRENPWLGAVEREPSAHPYHDWNARITAECYAPNAASRILDPAGRIIAIVNNYARMSFDVGPTLMAWLETEAPAVYQAICEADRLSRERFSGHGSALAHAYNHVILPLAAEKDRRTEIRWGIADFVHRFHRSPEGFWLPETAVDLPTLEDLAEAGIRFTVLAPHQAARVRRLGTNVWQTVEPDSLDPKMPYRVSLPSGRNLAVFFYDAAVARAVAFEGLLADGAAFADRLVRQFDAHSAEPQLVHIATDGETYGHHHRHGDMALAFALACLEQRGEVRLTNYGEYLERHPPTHEVEVRPGTSWSCPHGVERWRADCGCSTGSHPGWHQRWRAPLRAALDWLRDEVAPLFEADAGALLVDPWAARDDYIAVVLDRRPETVDAFLAGHVRRALSPAERIRLLKLLELERHVLLMYTSCGWFFDDLSGLETTQVLRYAGRAVQLAEDLFGRPFEAGLVARLAQAPSNEPAVGDGARWWQQAVRPVMTDLVGVGAHAAVLSVFKPTVGIEHAYGHRIIPRDRVLLTEGTARLGWGRLEITSPITEETARLFYAVLHTGDHQVTGVVRPFDEASAYAALAEQVGEAFRRGDFNAVRRTLEKSSNGVVFDLQALFGEERRAVLAELVARALEGIEAAAGELYARYAPLMRYAQAAGQPLPRAFLDAAAATLGRRLKAVLGADELDLQALADLAGAFASWGLAPAAEAYASSLAQRAASWTRHVATAPALSPAARRILAELDGLAGLGLRPDLTGVQDAYFQRLRQDPAIGDTPVWRTLGERLGIAVDRVPSEASPGPRS